MPEAECGFPDRPDFLVNSGPTLEVQIGFDSHFRSGQRPNLPPDIHPALVDTGAMASCIDSKLAAALRLPIVDRGVIGGVQGSFEANMHLAQIYIPTLNFTVYGRFAGVHLAAGGLPHVALMGRTFLRRFTMIYTGTTGRVVIKRP